MNVDEVPKELSKFILALKYSSLNKALEKTYALAIKVPEHHLDTIQRLVIPLGLRKLIKQRKQLDRRLKLNENEWIAEALSFIVYFNQTWEKLSDNARHQLSQDTLARLRFNQDIRPLMQELKVAYFFRSHGFSVSYPDLDGNGNFDLLAIRDSEELEVEVKTISKDSGSKIKQSDILRFADRIFLNNEPLEFTSSFDIILILENKLPAGDREQTVLADQVKTLLKKGQTFQTTPFGSLEIKLTNLSLEDISRTQKLEKIYELGQKGVKQYGGAEVYCTSNKNNVIRLCIKSRSHNELLTAITKKCKEGAKQLSTEKAGVVWLSICGVFATELNFDADPHPFDFVAFECFKNGQRKHVSALVFTADGEIQKTKLHEGYEVRSSEIILTRRNLNAEVVLPEDLLSGGAN